MDIDCRETYHDENHMSTTFDVILLKYGLKTANLVILIKFAAYIVDTKIV